MVAFVLRRLALLVVALLVSSFVIFAGLQLAPGDPLAALSGGRSLPPEALEALRAQYRLDDPFLVQYGNWLVHAVQGDLGQSIAQRHDVATIIGERIGVTAQLVALAAVIILVAGVGLGVLAGLRRGPVDAAVLVVTTLLAAIPSFVAAIVLMSVFAVQLGWFPAVGAGDGFADRLHHLVLPAIALAASALAIVARVTRASVREELEREHVETAVSRGLPRRLVLRRHVLRNAAIPIATVSGITILSLIALSAVVERAFGINGLGATLVQAAAAKDLALVQGISLVLVAAFVVGNTLVDLVYAVLDPRVTVGSRAA
ncbi:MAG: ABC transporter permease [Solirubrobacteraceae bacterium]|nr:ABC transporter permease [Solirubrobacteraceae bacterium]